jgi:acetyl-CoA carboxylase carboxyl transferase beta subunit
MAFLKRRRFISVIGRKSPMPDGVWMKCPGCKRAVYKAEVEANLQVCPGCNYHHRITARKRVEVTADPDSFQETHADIQTLDPLRFTVRLEDDREVTYLSKVEQAKQKSGLQEALLTGYCRIEGEPAVLGVMDPYFVGGSMGCAVGERFCRAVEDAVRDRLPLVVFAASGGARMQEGILSLMQMAKTADAVRALNDAALPYITIMTDPTYGGVYASFASLGDITLAEPGAMCGFAGPRLIEGALKVKLPPGFQSAEYQYEHGFIDQIVKRTELRPLLSKLLRYLAPKAA